jgi:hypothetical protein
MGGMGVCLINCCEDIKIMTRKETTAIALKCFAIYIISQLIIGIPSFVSLGWQIQYLGENPPSKLWIIIIPTLTVIIGLALAVFLWKFTNALMIKDTTSLSENSDIGIDEVVKIILGCMGVYFVIDALIVLPSAVAALSNQNYQVGDSILYLSAQILELIFGALLITKPGKWLKIIRSAGTEK